MSTVPVSALPVTVSGAHDDTHVILHGNGILRFLSGSSVNVNSLGYSGIQVADRVAPWLLTLTDLGLRSANELLRDSLHIT